MYVVIIVGELNYFGLILRKTLQSGRIVVLVTSGYWSISKPVYTTSSWEGIRPTRSVLTIGVSDCVTCLEKCNTILPQKEDNLCIKIKTSKVLYIKIIWTESVCYSEVWVNFCTVQLKLILSEQGVRNSPAGLVLAVPVFLKLKIKFHFNKKQVLYGGKLWRCENLVNLTWPLTKNSPNFHLPNF